MSDLCWFDGFLHSYPQVYPQIDLTDYIIRQGRSGVLWRIVEHRAYHRGPRNVKRVFLALSQTSKPVKPQTLYPGKRMISQI